jgi:hypothetical protein
MRKEALEKLKEKARKWDYIEANAKDDWSVIQKKAAKWDTIVERYFKRMGADADAIVKGLTKKETK